jgi:hypothetical protein
MLALVMLAFAVYYLRKIAMQGSKNPDVQPRKSPLSSLLLLGGLMLAFYLVLNWNKPPEHSGIMTTHRSTVRSNPVGGVGTTVGGSIGPSH